MRRERAAAFVEENLKTIFAYSLSRISHKEDAEDLTEDIVLAILQSADKIRDDNAFYGYIWGIAANTHRKFLRKRSRLSFGELGDDVPDEADFTEALSAREDIIRLRREIAMLSGEYRECTVAYYYDGLSCTEISEKLGISPEMVKYYLFKTRKILKEGICMEREFGEKSFKPAPFEFVTIFDGEFNKEYCSLFSRKLPGQILMSAYYTPMSTRELAVELGIASVYLEDEMAMLEKYGLVSRTTSGKYQTKLVMFTEDFTKEFHAKAGAAILPTLTEILAGVREKLEQVRTLNRTCEKLSDCRLLWGVLWPLIRRGHETFKGTHRALSERDVLYGGATGTNYGISEEEPDDEYGCRAFAGRAEIDGQYFVSAADFNVLPKKNRYFETVDPAALREKIHRVASGEAQPEFMILTEAEENGLFQILAAETSGMAELFQQAFDCACRLMHEHAPKAVSGQVDRIVFQTLIFRTVGLIGGCAVKSGALTLPDFDGPAAMYVRAL